MNIYPAGHLLCVNHGLYGHVGISDGNGMIYENSNARKGRGLVAHNEFSAGKEIIDLGILPGSRSVPEMMARAEALIHNQKSYHLLENNCEHFVMDVCGINIHSPQIQKALFSVISASIAIKATDPHVKGVAAGASVGALLTKNGEDAVKNSLIGASIGLILAAVLSS